jgi:hypothetical protein
MKVDGVYYDSTKVDKSGVSKANVVCQETLASSVEQSSLLKEVSDASKKIVDKVLSIKSDPNKKFIFATLLVDSESNIIINYLYIDKLKEYDLEEFQDIRTFKVSQKMKYDGTSGPLSQSCFTWFSKDILEYGKLILTTDTDCPVEETPESDEQIIKCSYHLDIFPIGVSSVTYHATNPLFKIVIKDQPLSQLDSYIWFQPFIVDNIFNALQENKFNVSLSEFLEDIMTDLEMLNKSPLVGNDMRECFINIINDAEMKVENAKNEKSAKDEFITFERFKVKYSSLTCYEASKDFGFNLLLMKSYGQEVKKIFQERDVYFRDEGLKVYIFEKISIFAIIILGIWYIYFVYFEIKKTVKFRHVIKKINFILNFGIMGGDDDKNGKPPTLHFETRLELGRVILNLLGIKVCLIGCVIVMLFAVLYANSRKKKHVLMYNENIVMMNTQKILSGVDNALTYLSKPGNNNPNAFTFGLHQLNGMIPSEGNEISPLLCKTETIRTIERLIIDNKGTMTSTVKLNTNDRDLKIVYESLIDMLMSYKNENSILMSRDMGLIFPYVDVATNGVLLLVSVGMLVYLMISLNPLEMMEDAKQYNTAITGNDVNIIECLLQKEDKFDEVNSIIVVACVVIIVIFLITMNINKVISSGSNYGIMLYNSSMYDNRMGYNMKV